MLNLIIIEDNLDLNELLVESLSGLDYLVTGFAKVSDYEKSDVTGNLFLLDLNLPEEDGLSFAARLKQRNPDAAIVILSARAGSAARVQSYLTGAETFLQKPCGIDEVKAALESAAQRIRRQTQKQTSLNTLTLSLGGLRLSSTYRGVNLTDEEVGLISALQRAQDRRICYADVIRIVDPAGQLTLPALEVRITRLNNKIKPLLGSDRLIRSIRKFGYTLVHHVTIVD